MSKHLTLLWVLLTLSATLQAENWMSRLPDDAYVAVLSIPGAHDAATGSGWTPGTEGLGDLFARTQDLTINELWNAGIRAFDLRPCVWETHMNLNHGIMPTVLHFEDVLYMLRDSLVANPSEFIVIHLLHETDGDQVENAYNERLASLLQDDGLKDFFLDFSKSLTVGQARGKMLILSRDRYATPPVTGGYFTNWTGEANWDLQRQCRIIGRKGTSSCYIQDYSDTHRTGGITTKVNAINKLLDYSTTHQTTNVSSIVWVMNFASAYSKVENLFGYEISSSDGYRDNATHTHATILEYLSTKPAGPTGIVLMDYAGVDLSNDYEVCGLQLTNAIIDNNFRYLDDGSGIMTTTTQPACSKQYYSLDGKRVSPTQQHGVSIVRHSDGSVTKCLTD
jgi:hypothetical protein